MAQFTYFGPQGHFQIPPETEGEQSEEIRLFPNHIVEIPNWALKMPYVQRLEKHGLLIPVEPTATAFPSFSTSEEMGAE